MFIKFSLVQLLQNQLVHADPTQPTESFRCPSYKDNDPGKHQKDFFREAILGEVDVFPSWMDTTWVEPAEEQKLQEQLFRQEIGRLFQFHQDHSMQSELKAAQGGRKACNGIENAEHSRFPTELFVEYGEGTYRQGWNIWGGRL